MYDLQPPCDLKNAVFYASMDKGHLLKLCSEIIKGYIKDKVWFIAELDGSVCIRGNNSKNTVSLELIFRDFKEYRCKEKQIVNLDIAIFFRLIKHFKKKSSVILAIENSRSTNIHIISDSSTYIAITRPQPFFIDNPNNYEKYPCLIGSKEFQGMIRDMQVASGKDITVTQLPHGPIEFSVRHQQYGKTCTLGSRIVGEKDINYNNFTNKYDINFFSKLVKIPNISSNVKIFYKQHNPICISFSIENIGTGNIYIRHLEDNEEKVHESTVSDEDSDFNSDF